MIEIEAKYFLGTEEKARALARKWNLPWHDGEFDVNRIYDFPDRRLRLDGALVRLRTRGELSWLTFKTRTDIQREGAKVRLEYDSEVSNPEAVALLLDRVGLVEVIRYERYRASHDAGEVRIEFDSLPGGWFCEIEGEDAAIRAKVAEGGLTEMLPIVWSYPKIFAHLLHKNGVESSTWNFALLAAGEFEIPPPGDPWWQGASQEDATA